jgi:hypothetical protein
MAQLHESEKSQHIHVCTSTATTQRQCSCTSDSSNGRHDVKAATLQMRGLCGLNLDSETSVKNLRDVISKQILSLTLSNASTVPLRSAARAKVAEHRTSH